MAKVCGAVGNGVLLSTSTRDVRYSGYLFSRFGTTSSNREAGLQGDHTHKHALQESMLKSSPKQRALALVCANSQPGATLWPLSTAAPCLPRGHHGSHPFPVLQAVKKAGRTLDVQGLCNLQKSQQEGWLPIKHLYKKIYSVAD